MTNESDNRLVGDSRWKLRTKLTSWRFVAFTHFMADVHEQLAILSTSFQSNTLIVHDIAKNVNRTLRQLEKLEAKPSGGLHEAAFWQEVRKDDGADVFKTSQLAEGGQAR